MKRLSPTLLEVPGMLKIGKKRDKVPEFLSLLRGSETFKRVHSLRP